MAKTWAVIEDDSDRAMALVKAIKAGNGENDGLIWIFAHSRVEKDKSLNTLGIDTVICNNREELSSAINLLTGDVIALVDINLTGIHEQGLDEKGSLLLNLLTQFLNNGSAARLIVLTSGQYNVQKQIAAFGLDTDDLRVIDGRAYLDNPRFRDENAKKVVREALEHWGKLTLKGHLLDEIWDKTRQWFTDDGDSRYKIGELPHNIKSYDNEKDKHRTVVQQIWPWFPGDWWSDDRSMLHLHHVLKCMCGNHFLAGVRNICVGSVYILAGLACVKRRIYNPFVLLKSWSPYPDCDRAVLPPQNSEVSKACARSLFDFFDKAFVEDKDATRLGECNVRVFAWSDAGGSLDIEVGWSAEGTMAKSLSGHPKPANEGHLKTGQR